MRMTRLVAVMALSLFVSCLVGITVTLAAGRTVLPGWEVAYASRERYGAWSVNVIDVDRRISYTYAWGFSFWDMPQLSPDRDYILGEAAGTLGMNDTHTHLTLLYNVQGDSPAWSPDSRRFAYYAGARVYLGQIGSNGLAERPQEIAVSDLIFERFPPAWSPDGTQLVFTARNEEGTWNVVLASLGRSSASTPDIEAQRVVGSSMLPVTSPAWSPNGGSLVFASQGAGGQDRIVILDVVNALSRELVLPDNLIFPTRFAWSPDGMRLAFRAEQAGFPRLFIMDVERQSIRELRFTNPADSPFLWSPDGERLVFIGLRDNDLYLINADGRDLHRVTDDQNYNILNP